MFNNFMRAHIRREQFTFIAKKYNFEEIGMKSTM